MQAIQHRDSARELKDSMKNGYPHVRILERVIETNITCTTLEVS